MMGPKTEYGKQQGFVKASIIPSHLFGKAMSMEDECKSGVRNEFFLFSVLWSREASFERLSDVFINKITVRRIVNININWGHLRHEFLEIQGFDRVIETVLVIVDNSSPLRSRSFRHLECNVASQRSVITLNSKGQSKAVIDSKRARYTCNAGTRGYVIYSDIIILITMSRYESAEISPMLILVVVKKSAMYDLIEAC